MPISYPSLIAHTHPHRAQGIRLLRLCDTFIYFISYLFMWDVLYHSYAICPCDNPVNKLMCPCFTNGQQNLRVQYPESHKKFQLNWNVNPGFQDCSSIPSIGSFGSLLSPVVFVTKEHTTESVNTEKTRLLSVKFQVYHSLLQPHTQETP